MARAGAHLSAGRIAEAEGAFRAVLSIDPDEHRAHLGLADCACAQGQGQSRVDHAVDRLVEDARAYADRQAMRPAFALLTKALAIAPSRLDLHIDVAELEAADGRSEVAAQRLEKLARTYASAGQHDEAALVLDAAAAFRTPEPEPEPAPLNAPFIDPHSGHETPAPSARVAATPPPPPPVSRVRAAPRHVEFAPTPTPAAATAAPMVRPSPLVAAPPPPPAAKATKRARRHTSAGPRWLPATAAAKPDTKPRKPTPGPVESAKAEPRRLSITPPPRPRAQAKPIATYPAKRPSIAPAPSPKRGGKKLDKLPSLKRDADLGARLRAASTLNGRFTAASDEDRTTMWQRPAAT